VEKKIAVIGLGYVGLPLAVEFGKKYSTIGFDIDESRIQQLSQGIERTQEVTAEELSLSNKLEFTSNPQQIASANFYIVTVPTPIDDEKRPDLTALTKASELVGKTLKPDDIVVFESTVFPGATEEVCVPLLESNSGLKYNEQFYVGYSPERINPGDKEHRLINIPKVTSGSTPEIATIVDDVYASIIIAGTHKAKSIKVAEAAKVIENTQRDLNIALVNELAKIFNKLDINTADVLEAAGTKWNFLPFQPGLVGGHCIGVDPYYLTHIAQKAGYSPEVILAGRRINDGMGAYIANQVVRLMISKDLRIKGAQLLILGFAFKENCPDIRNTKVVDLHSALESYEINVDVYDPCVSASDVTREYGIELTESIDSKKYNAIILAVAHEELRQMTASQVAQISEQGVVIYDVKNAWPHIESDGQL